MEGSTGRTGVKSLEKSLRVLECFSRRDRSLSLVEIADRAGLPRATAHRLLAALKAIGFIEQERGRERYRLGMKLFELGSLVLANMDLPREAQPFVQRLTALTGATVHLCVFDGFQAVFVDRRTEPGEAQNSLTLLEGAPVHCTGVGKAILAFQPPAAVDRVIADGLTGYTSRTITDPNALRAELARIRTHGWSVDDGEHQAGVRCIGAPIRNGAGAVIAAVSVSGPASRITPDRDETLARVVTGIAGELSDRLGWHR